MNKKVLIDGEPIDKQIPVRTTGAIYDTLADAALQQKVSLNLLINKILNQYVRKKKRHQSKDA